MMLAYFEAAIDKKQSGGGNVSARNTRFLERVSKEMGVPFCLLTPIDGTTIGSKIFKKLTRISYETFCSFRLKLSNEKITIVWLDRSVHGFLCLYLKIIAPNIKIYVYFHNDEFVYNVSQIRLSSKYWSRCNMMVDGLIAGVAQAICLFCSDHQFYISDTELKRYRTSQAKKTLLPPSWERLPTKQETCIIYDLLFVGSRFAPNIFAVNWLVSHKEKFDPYRIVICGLPEDIFPSQSSNFEIKGYVESLEKFYAKSKFSIIPVFHGAGLKVKLAESILNGRRTIASWHAAQPFHTMLPAEVFDEYIFPFHGEGDVQDAIARAAEQEVNLPMRRIGQQYFLDERWYPSFRQHFI